MKSKQASVPCSVYEVKKSTCNLKKLQMLSLKYGFEGPVSRFRAKCVTGTLVPDTIKIYCYHRSVITPHIYY